MEQKTGVRIDVQAIVEQPEIHIIGRSGASISDQMLFNECRQECQRVIHEPVSTQSGILIRDVMRFFHGDGPAQQFEAGHKQGGTYSCVSCGAKTTRFDDFGYCHYSEKRTFQECQEFVTMHGKKKVKCFRLQTFMDIYM